MIGVGRFLRDTIRVERPLLAPAVGLRTAVGVATPVALGVGTGHVVAGATAAAGALPAGMALFTATYRPPIGTMVVTSLGMAVATFVGAVTGDRPLLHLLLLVGWGFGAGLLVALGRSASLIGVQSVIGLLVMGRFPLPALISLRQAGLVLAGGLFQATLAAVIRRPRRYRAERAALADLYRALAARAADLSDSAAPARAAQATVDAAAILDSSPVAGRGQVGDALRGLLDEAGRIRLELVALATARDRLSQAEDPQPDCGLILDLTTGAARVLEEIAEALAGGRPPRVSRYTEDRVRAAVRRLRATPGHGTAQGDIGGQAARLQYAERAEALAGQLRAALEMAASCAGAAGRRGQLVAQLTHIRPPGQLRADLGTLRVNLTLRSSACRHAIRLALMLCIAVAVTSAAHLERAYWVPLTVLVVLKPDFGTTISRGLGRLGGTAVGVVLATVLVATLPLRGPTLIVLVAVAAWGAYAVFRANYAVFAAFVTALVVFLLSVVEPGPMTTIVDRAVDTLVGGVLAMVGYVLWPTWERSRVPDRLADLVSAGRTYAGLVLSSYAEPAAYDGRAVADAAAAERLARSNAEASVERSLGEPRRPGEADLFRGLLASARRLVIGVHVLAAHLQDTPHPSAFPAVRPLAADLDAALAALADAIRTGAAVPPLPPLRERHRDLASTLPDEGAPVEARPGSGGTLTRTPVGAPVALPVAPLVAAETDDMVDSVNTMAHLLSARVTQPTRTADGAPR